MILYSHVNIWQIGPKEGWEELTSFKVSYYGWYGMHEGKRIESVSVNTFYFSFLEDSIGKDTNTWPYVILSKSNEGSSSDLSHVCETVLQTCHCRAHVPDEAIELAYLHAKRYAERVARNNKTEVIDRTKISKEGLRQGVQLV